jgi:hypothetical protein
MQVEPTEQGLARWFGWHAHLHLVDIGGGTIHDDWVTTLAEYRNSGSGSCVGSALDALPLNHGLQVRGG